MSGDDWETLFDDFWGDVLRMLHRWETPQLYAFALHFFFLWFVFSFESSILTLYAFLCSYFTVKDRPELEGRFEEHVRAAIEYASTIDDFDDLVDPWTLAQHYLELEPSPYVLRAICHEEKSKLF